MSSKTCCGCFNLRNGSMAIGILFVIASCLGVLSAAVVGVYLTSSPHYQDQGGAIWQIALILAVSMTSLAFNSLLVHGARCGKASLVKIWLVYHGIYSALKTLAVALAFIVALSTGEGWIILLMIMMMALPALMWYWLDVVMDFYNELTGLSGFQYQTYSGEIERRDSV